MNQPTVRLVLAAALFLFIPLWTVNAAAADIKGALKYVPSDAFAVVGVNGDRVKHSVIYKKALEIALKERGAKRELDKIRKATGINVLKDIRSLVIAFDPKVIQDDDKFLAVVEVPVNQAKVLAFMKREGAKLQTRQGMGGQYYLLGRQQDGALAFRGKFIVVGDREVFERGMKKTGPGFKLAAQLRKVSSRALFVAVDPPKKVRQKLAKEDKNLGQLQALAAGAEVSPGLKLDAFAQLATAGAASQLEQMATGGLNQARNQREVKQFGLDSLLNGITITSQGRELTAKLRLSSADLQQLIDTAIKLIGI
jgi:hypothetical protein